LLFCNSAPVDNTVLRSCHLTAVRQGRLTSNHYEAAIAGEADCFSDIHVPNLRAKDCLKLCEDFKPLHQVRWQCRKWG
jgi:hypothetical protein